MRLPVGHHLAYCTNIHPAESWAETFSALERFTLRVKARVQPRGAYGIGLRLSDRAARELASSGELVRFQRWLDANDCYVFTINGFPFGQFHGGRVKEQVYAPDWTDARRLEYTNRLFDLLVELLPADVEGSVSTLPGSFKDFIQTPAQEQAVRDNVWRCVEHVARLAEHRGRKLHLGLEPEPFGYFENSMETVQFFERLRGEHAGDARLDVHLGVNYDTCHLAIEFESPAEALGRLREHQIRLSKIHLSNALRLTPTPGALGALAAFADDVYLHQVIIRHGGGNFTRFRDLGPALQSAAARAPLPGDEWRVHFHVPLQTPPTGELQTTADHVTGVLRELRSNPSLCAHLEMETYTWGVMPEALRTRDVVDQLVGETEWTSQQLVAHGLA